MSRGLSNIFGKSTGDEVGLMTAFQSAYRKHHSIESAVLNIHNDILLNMAKGSVTALTLLDLSAAFDTIDHTILLDRLFFFFFFFF